MTITHKEIEALKREFPKELNAVEDIRQHEGFCLAIDHLAATGRIVPDSHVAVPVECLGYLADESKFDKTVTAYVQAMIQAAQKGE